jgi:hypothetical protein
MHSGLIALQHGKLTHVSTLLTSHMQPHMVLSPILEGSFQLTSSPPRSAPLPPSKLQHCRSSLSSLKRNQHDSYRMNS